MDQFRHIIGHAPIHDFMHFAKVRTAKPADDIALTGLWREASALRRQLAVSDRDYADVTALQPLPDEIVEEAQAELRDPTIQKSLGFLPFSWYWLELDRLVLYQQFVETSFADRLRSILPSEPKPADLLRVAVGHGQEPPPIQVLSVNRSKFTFASVSTDLRVLGAVPLDPKDVHGYQPYGRVRSVIGVFVGYSINVMSAVALANRVMLVNGYHRAYALRALGITHVPCIVSLASSGDDLDVLGFPISRTIIESRLAMPRPPLLKDFFDDRLSITIDAPSESQLVQLELKFEHARAPTPQGVM